MRDDKARCVFGMRHPVSEVIKRPRRCSRYASPSSSSRMCACASWARARGQSIDAGPADSIRAAVDRSTKPQRQMLHSFKESARRAAILHLRVAAVWPRIADISAISSLNNFYHPECDQPRLATIITSDAQQLALTDHGICPPPGE